MRTRRGFSLIELMIVVAIMAILATLAITGYREVGWRGAAQAATRDFSQALSTARARALERGTEVWLIIYPEMNANGAAGGNGAFFLYEDADVNFATSGTRNWGNFKPPLDIEPSSGEKDRLLGKWYFDNYAGKNAKFALSGTMTLGAPFIAATVAPCSFCSLGPNGMKRGALIFMPDGSVRFADGTEMMSGPVDFSTGGRAGTISILGPRTRQQYVFAVSGPTGYLEAFSK